MRTKQMRLIDALSDPEAHFVVPVYQRVYSWTQPHCEALLRDSLAAVLEGRPHFVGTLLYRDAGMADGLRELTLIDGQQRLATLALLAQWRNTACSCTYPMLTPCRPRRCVVFPVA